MFLKSTLNFKVVVQKKLFEQSLQSINMLLKTLASLLSNAVLRIWFASNKLLGRLHISNSFQRLEVTSQIAISQIQKLFEHIEVGRIVHHKYGHDAQTYTALESFVMMFFIIYCYSK